MIVPGVPINDVERVHALRVLDILDTAPEERFDRVTRMAKRMFGVSISLVSLVDQDRQWFKSAQGLAASETPREISFCGHAINQDELFVVPNALEDARFHDNPLVLDDPNIRFYAGYPLQLRPGVRIGTLCLIDPRPRLMSEEDKQLLRDLGSMVEREIRSVQLATLDELTQLSNRRGFLSLAEHMQKVCRRNRMPITAVLFDLNKFKPINDRYGHHEGDAALKAFAGVLLETMRECDVIGRWGGDEFAVLLSDTDAQSVDHALARLGTAIEAHNRRSDKPYEIAFSAGVAHFPYDTDLTVEAMIQQADYQMYQQKERRIS